MVAVRMMEVAGNAVVGVIAVRNCLMAAIGAMDMAGLMLAASVIRGAPIGIVAGDIYYMLINVIFMRMVKVTIVQIVDVAAVSNCGVAAPRSVLVSMVGMVGCGAGSHGRSSFLCP